MFVVERDDGLDAAFEGVFVGKGGRVWRWWGGVRGRGGHVWFPFGEEDGVWRGEVGCGCLSDRCALKGKFFFLVMMTVVVVKVILNKGTIVGYCNVLQDCCGTFFLSFFFLPGGPRCRGWSQTARVLCLLRTVRKK